MSSNNNKKYDFTGKIALVTGSSSGIGAAIAIQFAQYGARVTITGRNRANLDKISQHIELVSGGEKPHQVIDFLINNAGGATPVGTLESYILLEEFDSVFKLNVRSVVELTQLSIPHLSKTKGNIINISSIASKLPVMLIYCASKAALDMITKTSALELGPKGIRVNSINPGPVAFTAIGRSLGFDQNKTDQINEIFRRQSLMKRIGQSEDIANLASFLASDDARNITGSIYVIDGGALISNQNFNREDVEAQLN